MDFIRNFSIIAHIDHGKSTLADRFIQRCGGLADREMEAQVLDTMDLERERGITIKAQTAALLYTARDGREYHLNLIDTPGHVDFAYEVSRSLAACEGALLVVDASQGVEAQTVANCYTATEQGVTVVPVLNKIDLPSAEPDRVTAEIEDIIGIPAHDALRCSAKTGEGVDDVLVLRLRHLRFVHEQRRCFRDVYPVMSSHTRALMTCWRLSSLGSLRRRVTRWRHSPRSSSTRGSTITSAS